MLRPCHISRAGRSLPTHQRTRTTELLWQMRTRAAERAQRSTTPSLLNAVSPLAPRAPRESVIRLDLPFSKDEDLRAAYLSPFGHVRVGRLLEDLDAFAGNVAWAHAGGGDTPLSLVTASLDRLHLRSTLLPDRDLRIEGRVTCVGSSSLEIRVVAEANVEGKWKEALASFFTMVAVDPLSSKPIKVAPLLVRVLAVETEEERQLQAAGERNKERRKAAASAALHMAPPTAEERLVVHDLFMRSKKLSDFTYMDRTSREALQLCQPQERNISNKIFGGFLMRKAFELAFVTGYLHARTQPFFHGLDDVSFQKPVEIGAMLQLRAIVAFTASRTMLVEVTAHVLNPEKGTETLTNKFFFTFVCERSDAPVRPVIPQTYEEAMKYIEGKRKWERRLEDDKECAA